MGRDPLSLGSWGRVRIYAVHWDKKGKPDRHKAVTRYRDFDGRIRQVQSTGRSRSDAERRLRTTLQERSTSARPGNGELTARQKFDFVSVMWLHRVEEMVREGRRSPGTLRTYRGALDKHVSPALGQLRLAEVTTPVVDAFIARMRTDVSASSARLCRSIVSGIMSIAVRKGAVVANPVREVERIEATRKKSPRALSRVERRAWLAHLRSDAFAVRRDLPDLSEFMIATGARIGETIAVLWSGVDLEEGVVNITSTIVRSPGVGLVRKSTKSAAGQRSLALPSWAVSMLRRRYTADAQPYKPVFPDAVGGYRDPSNTMGDLRRARGVDSQFSWVTSHHLRKTTATILDDAGLSARAVADQLGHSRPSMTQDVYMARRLTNPQAADALEDALDDD